MNSFKIKQEVIDERTGFGLTTFDGQIAKARQMRRDDLHSMSGKRPPGAEALITRIEQEALRTGVTIKRMISPEHLRRFLPKNLEGDDVRYPDLDLQPPFLRSYLQRLALVKKIFNLEGRLTEAEAKSALRVYHEFSDPHGETVDLIPQFAFVHEIAERKANSRPIQDIDDYFACAPWKSDANKDLYSFAIKQSRTIPPQLRLICPFIPTGTTGISAVLLGAHVHLGMPYALNYRTPFGSGENPNKLAHKIILWESPDLELNKSPEELRNDCQWQVQFKMVMTGQFSSAVHQEIIFDNQEKAKEPTGRREESEESND